MKSTIRIRRPMIDRESIIAEIDEIELSIDES
jgi:hypothetical protein